MADADGFVDEEVRPDAGRTLPLEEGPRWRGVHHLALTTNDMDATVRFYHGVLGMRIVATIATDSFRHYFFEIGPGATVAFFEFSGVDVGTHREAGGRRRRTSRPSSTTCRSTWPTSGPWSSCGTGSPSTPSR